MEREEIQRIVTAEVSAARRFQEENVSSDRTKRWDRYYGRPLGNERKGQSRWMSRDVMDTIEWMLPYLVRTFTAGDPKIRLRIKGQPDWVGRALEQQIFEDLDSDEEQSLFLLFYQWIKDALVSNTAAVKVAWARDFETVRAKFGTIGPEQAAELQADPDVGIESASETVDFMTGQVLLTDVVARVRKVIRDDLRADNIPHWELLFSPKAKTVNDEHGKGHATEVSLDYLKRINRAMSAEGRPFFTGLDALEKSEAPQGSGPFVPAATGEESEKDSYLGRTETATAEVDERGARSRHKLVEWYTRIDVDDDGYLEDVVCWIVDDRTLIRWEKNRDGIIPMSVISPILDCYKFLGISYAELVIEVQNLKTMIIRRILDNYAYSNNGRWLVRPGVGVDVATLLQNKPGDVVFGDPDAVKDLAPKAFHPGILSLVEYADTVRENRTGVTRYNQGMDAQSLNKTATGIAAIQSAAHQRLEMVARVMAETGVRDFWRKCARLYQLYMSRPFEARLDGRTVTVTPDMIQGDIVCRVDFGTQAQIGIAESQQIERMFAFLAQVNREFPGILQPETVYKLVSRYVASFGHKDATELIGSLQDYIEEVRAAVEASKQAGDEQQQAWAAEKEIEMSRIEGEQRLGALEQQTKRDIAEIHASTKLLTALGKTEGIPHDERQPPQVR